MFSWKYKKAKMMTDDELGIEVISYTTIEVTLNEPATESEILHLVDCAAEKIDTEMVANQSGRILLFASEDLQEVLQFLVGHGFVYEIGLIKLVTELEPMWSEELMPQGRMH